MRGWRYESARHSLAAKGISTQYMSWKNMNRRERLAFAQELQGVRGDLGDVNKGITDVWRVNRGAAIALSVAAPLVGAQAVREIDDQKDNIDKSWDSAWDKAEEKFGPQARDFSSIENTVPGEDPVADFVWDDIERQKNLIARRGAQASTIKGVSVAAGVSGIASVADNEITKSLLDEELEAEGKKWMNDRERIVDKLVKRKGIEGAEKELNAKYWDERLKRRGRL